MKKYLIIFSCLLAFYATKAQDVIVTSEGDTLACKITKVEKDFIHFSIFDKSGIILMRSRLPLSKVQFYQQNDDDNEYETPQIREEDRVEFEEFEPTRIRLAVNTGFTYQVGGYEGLPSSYKKQLQELWNFGGDLHFFIVENFGFGIKYNHAYTGADEDFEPPYSSVFGFSRLRDEKVTFDYLALSLLYRKFLYDDQVVNYFVSAGQVKYRTDGLGDGIPFYQEGKTLGVVLGVGYDFIFTQHMGIGATAEVNIAKLNKFDNNGSKVSADFDITRIDLTLGIRFY